MDVVTRFIAGHGRMIDRWPLERARAQLERLATPTDMTRRVTSTSAEIGSVKAIWVEPPGRDDPRTVLYLHGGAFITGSHRTHADTLARIAVTSRSRVFAPDYRLAPEHPYPAALEDVRTAYRWLVQRVPLDQVVVAGDSSGANLALALLIDLRDQGEPLPAAGVLISGWFDLTGQHPSMTDAAPTDAGDRAQLLRAARRFAGTLPLDDPRVSPLRASVAGLPPLFVQVGASEMVRDENLELVQQVRAAGGRVDLDLVDHHPHTPIFYATWSPPAREASERLGTWIRQRPIPPARTVPSPG